MRFVFFLVLSLISFMGINAPVHALTINEVRFGVHPDKTRMVIELDGQTPFKSFVLPKEDGKPYRLVVDFPDFNWKAGTIKRPPKTTILDVRTGTLSPGIMRLVVDVEQPLIMESAFTLPKKSGQPDKLVIDFKTVSTATFNATPRKNFGALNSNAPVTNQSENSIERLIRQFEKPSAPQTTAPIITATGIPVPAHKPDYTGTTIPKPASPLRKKIIVLDPGHGGNDPGASGTDRLKEKNITLAAARELKQQLERTGRFTVHLTRDNDTYIKLYKRVAIARARNADLFISLHADSIDKPGVRGASIYTLSDKASDAQTAKLAARENQADLIAGVDLSHEDKEVADILLDLAMRDTMNQSKFFANTVVKRMGARGVRILERPHRFAGFAVLKAPDVPSVLVEMGFMSNRDEARLLNTTQYRQKIAAALVDSVETYFEKIRQNGLN